MTEPNIDWEGILWEARGYLDLDEDAPVPRDKLVAQATANGWSEREVRDSLRSTDELESVNDDVELLKEAAGRDDTDRTPAEDPSEPVGDCDTSEGCAPVRHRSSIKYDDTESPDGGGSGSGEGGESGTRLVDNSRNRATEAHDDKHGDNPWGEVAHTAETHSGEYPPAWGEAVRWMCRIPEDKHSFAPWADRDHPEADPEKDARYKWGLKDNYADLETALEWDQKHPRTDGVTFQLIDAENEPFAFVDGDDVVDPETGEWHPKFVEYLNRLGFTYADISTSASGVHAPFRGDLPDGVKQAKIPLDDEPWGANDDPPVLEFYDHKKVCVATGEHVPGTPLNVNEWDEDELKAILNEHGLMPDRPDNARSAYEDFELSDYEPTAAGHGEVTDDIRDLFAALERLDARRVADRTIVHSWNDDATTSEGKRAFIPTWGPDANGTANVVDENVWQDTGGGGYGTPVVMALIDIGEMRPDTASPRDATGELWWKGVDRLRELGYDIPQYIPEPTSEDGDPQTDGVALDAATAYEAAAAVTPADLDVQPLPTTEDDQAWDHHGTRIERVERAVGLGDQQLDTPASRITDRLYHSLYERARQHYGAPIPQYMDRRTRTDRWHEIQGALEALDFFHLDQGAIHSTLQEPGASEEYARLDPDWRESESGESVVVFDSGIIYDHDSERVIDPLRFVALEIGMIDTPDDDLSGEDFRAVYHAARTVYGAPLPEWDVGDIDHVPMLPPAEDLVGEVETDRDRLDRARDNVQALYREVADERGETTVLRVLPGLGKSHNAITYAERRPTLYTAPRKELQREALERARKHDIDWMVLPVLGCAVDSESVQEGAAAVREHGKDLLRTPDALLNHIENEPTVATIDEDDTEDLPRANCETAAGEHGDRWALRVAVAAELDHTPREIHTRDEALFGQSLPCCGHGSKCPYSAAWERATDPEAPIDLLIGSRAHAHVPGARVHRKATDHGIDATLRTVVVDEFPGDAYAEEFGEVAFDHARWLATALRDDIDDRQDLMESRADLWNDDLVRSWLLGDGTDVNELHTAKERITALAAATEAVGLLEARDLDLDEDLVGQFPEWDEAAVRRVRDSLEDDGESSPLVDSLSEFLAAAHVGDWGTGPDEWDAPPVDGDLRAMVQNTIDACSERRDGAAGLARATVRALKGGEEGCEALAVHAQDGYSHRDAWALLYGFLAEGEQTSRVATRQFAFDGDDGTTVESVDIPGRRETVVVDRNHHGAMLLQPPGMSENPVVGLDGTAVGQLWEVALGGDVQVRDIFDTDRERRAFLQEAMNLQVVQTSDHMQTYSGNPESKNFDDAIELVRQVADQYGGHRLAKDNLLSLGEPAAITTKKAKRTIKPAIEDVAATVEHYGDITGSNALGEHLLGTVLGTRHYGDAAVERWCTFAGEEPERSGRGSTLDYGCPTGNAYRWLMQEGQTLQAILRFTRDEAGAIVFAHTAAIADELPVVADGAVARAHSRVEREVADAVREQHGQFTIADVIDDVDASKRQVRRVLASFASDGYLERFDPGEGLANEYEPAGDPGVGQADLPDLDPPAPAGDPGQTTYRVPYTRDVRVRANEDRSSQRAGRSGATLSAPDAITVRSGGGHPPDDPV